MSPFSLAKNLLRALAAYWELKAKRYEHDLRENVRNRLEELEDELENLRNDNSIGATLAADRLRDRIRDERRYAKHLSVAYTAPAKRD